MPEPTAEAIVQLAAAKYRIDKPLNVPEGVTLAGVWEAPHHAQLSNGTVLRIYAGKNDENGPARDHAQRLERRQGHHVLLSRAAHPRHIAYPYTIQGKGMHGSVIDCTFVNPYKAIDFGTYANELHYIRNCFGCPLKIGVHIDKCTDIGRIENVHFNPHYWGRAGSEGVPEWGELVKYIGENLVAFEFARTDWEYVLNTFVFGAKIGYRFYNGPGWRLQRQLPGDRRGLVRARGAGRAVPAAGTADHQRRVRRQRSRPTSSWRSPRPTTASFSLATARSGVRPRRSPRSMAPGPSASASALS